MKGTECFASVSSFQGLGKVPSQFIFYNNTRLSITQAGYTVNYGPLLVSTSCLTFCQQAFFKFSTAEDGIFIARAPHAGHLIWGDASHMIH